MKKKIPFFSLFIFSFFLKGFFLFAQSNAAWEPVKLDVAGHNIVNEVEGAFKKITCDNEEFIVIKFTNKNKYPVEIKWYDAILIKNNSWFKKDNSTAKKTLKIEANESIEGKCFDENNSICLIKLKDFINDVSDYQLYAIYRFEVIELKK